MDRREFIALGTAAAVAPGAALAQPAKVYRVASLTAGPPMAANVGSFPAMFADLQQRGYTLGQNLVYEPRGAAGQPAKLPSLVQELKAISVDAIVTLGYPPAAAAKGSGIPTVIATGSGDPVATGLVDGLARPGGNITGISDVATTLSTKRLSLLKETVPSLRRVAMLWNKDDLGMSLRYEASAKAAQELGVTVQALGVREPDDFNDAFVAMNREPPDAILMVSDSLTLLNRKRVIDFATERRLPAIFESDALVRDGGLMSYGADQKESFRRVAAFLDRIFNGTRPADLPFEQPTRYLFVLNLKTAKAMNLTVPATALALADEVIE